MSKPKELTISEETLERIRLQALMGQFARADSILSGRELSCDLSVDLQRSSPSWTDGKRITFNLKQLPSITDTHGLVVLNGLNYHELSHVLYTPDHNHALISAIQSQVNPIWEAFNILEDQRIEGMLIAAYPAVAPYLTATVAAYFMDADSQETANGWPFIFGRRYLPQEMRDTFRSAFVKKYSSFPIDEMEKLVTDYKKLRFYAVKESAVSQIVAMIRRFGQMLSMLEKNGNGSNPFDHGNTAKGTAGGMDDVSAQEVEAAEEQTSAQGVSGDADGDASDDADNGYESGSGDSDDDSDGQGGKSDGDDDSDKGSGESDDDSDTVAAGSTGKSKLDADKVLSQIVRDVENSPEIREELRRQRNVVYRLRKGRHTGSLRKANTREVDVRPEVIGQAKRFARELQSIVEDEDPGYDKHRDSGRLNVQRALQGGEIDTVFDQWNPGKQDTTSIETVVMVDVSGSMSGRLREALEAAWCIKYAHDQLGDDARCTVIAFETVCTTLYESTERAARGKARVCSTGGGTNPHQGLVTARDIFAISDRCQRILITVSDGAWSQFVFGSYGLEREEGADQIMQSIRGAGVYTASLFIVQPKIVELAKTAQGMDSLYQSYGHSAELFVPSSGTQEIVPLGRRMVKAVMKR